MTAGITLAVLVGVDLAAREPFGEHLLRRGRQGRGRGR
jgi:hypothetical protein